MNPPSALPRDPYPSDLTDEQWARVADLLEDDARIYAEWNSPAGRVASAELRQVADAVLYQARTAIPWRYLPRDIYGQWQTVFAYRRAWEKHGTLRRLYEALGLTAPGTGRRKAAGPGARVRARRSPSPVSPPRPADTGVTIPNK